MKHKHYDKIVAKADNMDLVVFTKSVADSLWYELHCDTFPVFEENKEYFLCLPQHKEACLAWLNGDDIHYQHNRFNDEYGIVVLSKEVCWAGDCIFMRNEYTFTKQPRKVKRWIAVKPDGYVMPQFYFNKASAMLASPLQSGFVLSEFQFIEIEVEENK